MFPLILSLPFLYLLARRPVLRRLAVRNATRRPRETALVVLGALLGTAIITSSYVVGDTLSASIRRGVYTQLGPVDELVVAPDGQAGAAREAVTGASLTDVDGTLPLTTLIAAVAAGGARPKAEPRAQVIETDFAAARRFGGDPKATGMSGPTPTGSGAVLGADLARTLAVRPGASVTVYAFGAARVFRVERVLPRLGVAGLARLDQEGSESPNVFVAPGTLAAMRAGGGPGTHTAPPTSMIAISNRGGVVAGAATTSTVQRQLGQATAGLQVRVVPVKQTLLDNADQSGKQFTMFFQSFGYFGVLAGVLLLVNIFVMLAQERKASLGMLRAVGLRRASLVGSFSLEGWVYALASAAAGALVGIGVGRLVVVVASGIFGTSSGGRRTALDLHFSITLHSILQGFTIGFVIALVTVLLTSLYIARLNVIRAIRDLPEPPSDGRGAARTILAVLLTTAGGVLTVAGVAGSKAVPALVGPALAAAGIEPLLGRILPRRAVISVTSMVVLLWTVFAFGVIPRAFDKSNFAVFVVQGVVLTTYAVLLVTPNQGAIGAAIRAVGGGARNMSLRLGLAYPLAKRARTGLTLAMYAIVVFVLTLLVTISYLFGGQASAFTRKLAGGADIEVQSNPASPIPADGVRALAGVRWVTATSTTPAEFPKPGSTEADTTAVVGFDDSFIGHGAPQLSQRPPGDGSDAATYRAVAADPTKILVSRDFSPGRQRRGPGGGGGVNVGDTVTLRDTVSGATRKLHVAGLVEEAAYGGTDHAFVSSSLAQDVFGARATTNLLFVGTTPGTDDVGLATTINGRYLAAGADANAFARLVAARLAQQKRFLTLIRGYVALGLLVGVAGLGVVMVRAVRERRREIGVLRSLGFSGVAVRRAFVAESAFIALEGVGIGAGLALVTCWRLVSSNTFGDHLPFSVPWLQLLVLVAGTFVASLLATAAPAQQASRIRPAVALRIAD